MTIKLWIIVRKKKGESNKFFRVGGADTLEAAIEIAKCYYEDRKMKGYYE